MPQRTNIELIASNAQGITGMFSMLEPVGMLQHLVKLHDTSITTIRMHQTAASYLKVSYRSLNTGARK